MSTLVDAGKVLSRGKRILPQAQLSSNSGLDCLLFKKNCANYKNSLCYSLLKQITFTKEDKKLEDRNERIFFGFCFILYLTELTDERSDFCVLKQCQIGFHLKYIFSKI